MTTPPPLLDIDDTLLIQQLLAPTGLARVVTELPDNLGQAVASLPVLQVVRAGGPNDRVVTDNPIFVLHAFVTTVPNGPKVAKSVLRSAFITLVSATGVPLTVDGRRAVIGRVDSISGPSPAPYENPSVRHAVSTVQARIKAA